MSYDQDAADAAFLAIEGPLKAARTRVSFASALVRREVAKLLLPDGVPIELASAEALENLPEIARLDPDSPLALALGHLRNVQMEAMPAYDAMRDFMAAHRR